MTDTIKDYWLFCSTHEKRVALLSQNIALKLNLFLDDIELIYAESLLHETSSSKMLKEMDVWYEEKKGFIPLLSRIFAIAHEYDRYRYELNYSKNKAIEELIKLSGTKFDPHISPIAIKIIKGF